ncbi:MAG: hypothetical protein AABY33_08490 [Pseudomonadota bacterium]
MNRLRILPAIIVTAVLLLFVKVVSVIRDTESLLIGSVEAQQAEKPSNVSTEKPANLPDQGASAKKPDDKKAGDKKMEDKKGDEKKGDEKKPEGDGKEESKKEDKKEENPNVSKNLESSAEHRFTAVEIELLQSLSKRREELERWENNIQIKEVALGATQKRIDDKIKQIEAMKKQVAVLLAQYNDKEDAKINSLVKIYENMKPAEAARIFDEIEMPILLMVINAMAEKKAAPILAAMNPKKAKQLTVELANERKINTKITTGAESQIAPSASGNTPADASKESAQAAPPSSN